MYYVIHFSILINNDQKYLEINNMNYYLSTDKDTTNSEWKWDLTFCKRIYRKKKKYPIPGQYLIDKDKIKYNIIDVVVYTDEFTMINDYGKDYGKKRSVDETNYDMCFWNRLSDDDNCHITFLVCCNKCL